MPGTVFSFDLPEATSSNSAVTQTFTVKRTVKPHLDHAELGILFVKIIDGFVRCFAAGTHQDDDVLRVRSANVIEQIVSTTRQRCEFVHHLLDHIRAGGVDQIGGFTALEKRVGILRRAPEHRMFRRHAMAAMLRDQLHIDQLVHHGFFQQFNFADFVRSAKAIKKMHEGQARTQGGNL